MAKKEKIKIELGTSMLVTFSGTTTPMKGLFVGMEHGQYLVLRFPAGSGVHDHLYEGNELVVRYVHDGQVFGFRSVVFGYMFKKRLMLVVIAYPSAFETHYLRREQRVGYHVPAQAAVGDAAIDAYVVDLSPNGCRLLLDDPEDLPFNPNKLGNLTLSFPFIGLEGVRNFSCIVKNVVPGPDKKELYLGLEFDKVDETVIETIRGYIKQVSPLFE